MKSVKIALVLITVMFSVSNTFSQMPKQAESKFLDQLVGTWKGVVETPMGKSNTDVVCDWSLNHMFLVVKVKGTGETPMNSYESVEYYQPLENGKLAFWSFNGFGEVTTGGGTVSDTKYEYTDSSQNGSETGVMNLDGSNMTFNTKGKYTMNGQTMDFNMTGTFKKK